MKKIFTQNKQRQGFTLIETLIANTIITIVILGPLTVAITSSSYAKDTKNTIIATYLAHEGTEFVRFKRDSAYLECENDIVSCPKATILGTTEENIAQVSWRTFKDRFRQQGIWPSCFTDDNIEGCSLDIFGTTSTGSGVGERYVASDSNCTTLYRDDRVDQTSPPVITGMGVTDRIYVCKVNGELNGYTDSGFTRVIKLTSVYSQYANDYEKQYEDDVRVESVVTYIKGLGIIRTIKAVDYLHARP